MSSEDQLLALGLGFFSHLSFHLYSIFLKGAQFFLSCRGRWGEEDSSGSTAGEWQYHACPTPDLSSFPVTTLCCLIYFQVPGILVQSGLGLGEIFWSLSGVLIKNVKALLVFPINTSVLSPISRVYLATQVFEELSGGLIQSSSGTLSVGFSHTQNSWEAVSLIWKEMTVGEAKPTSVLVKEMTS